MGPPPNSCRPIRPISIRLKTVGPRPRPFCARSKRAPSTSLSPPWPKLCDPFRRRMRPPGLPIVATPSSRQDNALGEEISADGVGPAAKLPVRLRLPNPRLSDDGRYAPLWSLRLTLKSFLNLKRVSTAQCFKPDVLTGLILMVLCAMLSCCTAYLGIRRSTALPVGVPPQTAAISPEAKSKWLR